MSDDLLDALALAMAAPIRCAKAPFDSCRPPSDRLIFWVNRRCSWPACTQIARPAAPEEQALEAGGPSC